MNRCLYLTPHSLVAYTSKCGWAISEAKHLGRPPKLLMCNLGPLRTRVTGLRAPDQYTSNTLIGGKGGDGPSSLHTMLEGPIEYVKARWM
jgi:hypothetical protein